MAEIIQIDKERFDELFTACIEKLRLERFVEGGGVVRADSEFENSPIGMLHRTFVYEVCKLKDKLIKS